jgi:hypothetical protein
MCHAETAVGQSQLTKTPTLVGHMFPHCYGSETAVKIHQEIVGGEFSQNIYLFNNFKQELTW